MPHHVVFLTKNVFNFNRASTTVELCVSVCGVVWCGWLWLDVAGCGWVWLCVAGCGVVWLGVAGCGLVWRGVMWYGVAGVVYCDVVWLIG